MPTPYEQPEPTGVVEGVEPVELKNYASTESVVDELRTKVLPVVQKARDNRRAKVEQDWERYRDVYNMRRTQSYYEGRSKLFLGILKDAVDTLVRIAKDSLLSDPCISVETDNEKWKAVAVKFYSSLLEDQAKIRGKVSMYLRQLYQLGTSCFKFGWQEVSRQVKYRERGEQGLEIKTRKQYECYGPSLEVVDMAHVYVWPETATSYDGLRMVWEDSVTTFSKLRAKAKKGFYSKEAVEEVISIKETALEEKKRPLSQESKETAKPIELAEDELDITELWVKFQLPGVEAEEEDPWVWVTYCGEIILRVQENPWWFQTPPYLFGAIFREHDYFYGHGIIEASEMWQYMANDLVNQSMDAGAYSLNPITLLDPAVVDDPDMYQFEPMAKWMVTPDAVRMERPPPGMFAEGMQGVRFLIDVMQNQTKANAVVSGAPREGLGRAVGTATGISQMTAAGNAAVIDQIEEQETQVFTPLLKMTEIACHQFMDEAIALRKTGPDGVLLTQRVVEPQDLVLSSDLRWIASLRLREKLSKSQGMINLFNIAVGVSPELARSQGFRIKYKEMLVDAANGLGADNADRYVEDITVSVPGMAPELEEELTNAGRLVEAATGETIEYHMAHIQAHMLLPTPESSLAKQRKMELIMSHQARVQEMMAIQAAKAQEAMGAAPGGASGAQFPVRPQEQPALANEGAASQGIMSQEGGSTGFPG